VNARLAKPIPLGLVYYDAALLFATPALMPLKSPSRVRRLICEDFGWRDNAHSRRLAAMAIPPTNALLQRTIDEY
jgi:hypothetical protein